MESAECPSSQSFLSIGPFFPSISFASSHFSVPWNSAEDLTAGPHKRVIWSHAECHPCFIQGTWEAPLAEVVPLVVPGWAAPAPEAPEARITPALERLAPLGPVAPAAPVTCWPREAVEWHLLHLIFRRHLHHSSPAYLVGLVPFSCTFLIHFIFSRLMTQWPMASYAFSWHPANCKLLPLRGKVTG